MEKIKQKQNQLKIYIFLNDLIFIRKFKISLRNQIQLLKNNFLYFKKSIKIGQLQTTNRSTVWQFFQGRMCGGRHMVNRQNQTRQTDLLQFYKIQSLFFPFVFVCVWGWGWKFYVHNDPHGTTNCLVNMPSQLRKGVGG